MYTEESSIIGLPNASVEQAIAYMLARPHGEYSDNDISTVIVPGYFALCFEIGLDPILAIAQMIHETGNLTSFWAARPQRNPAGIGVNGKRQPEQPQDTSQWSFNSQRQLWERGCSFASWQHDAIPAHVGRLAAYALGEQTCTISQQLMIQRALAYRSLPTTLRGTAPILKALGKAHNPTGIGWASPGTDYGAKVAAIAQRIVG